MRDDEVSSVVEETAVTAAMMRSLTFSADNDSAWGKKTAIVFVSKRHTAMKNRVEWQSLIVHGKAGSGYFPELDHWQCVSGMPFNTK